MNCKHEQYMCRNCVKICLKCGAELPADFGTDKQAQEPAKKTTTRKKVK